MLEVIWSGIQGFSFVGIQEYKEGCRIATYRCDVLYKEAVKAGFCKAGEKLAETEFVLLPPDGHNGRFLMGSPETEKGRSCNEQLRQERIVKPFLIAKTCLSQRMYIALGGTSDDFQYPSPKKPATNMNWCDATATLRKIGLRLPTEAEWEFACRAGTTTPYAFGEALTTELANYDGELEPGTAGTEQYRGEPVDVASLPHNGYGLYEMHGNVLEWCADWYTDRQTGDTGLTSSNYRVLRGGCWMDPASGCRSAVRCSAHWMDRSDLFGCRPAADVM